MKLQIHGYFAVAMLSSNGWHCSGLSRGVLRKVLVAVSVHDGIVRVRDGQRFCGALAIDVILSASVHGEVRLFVDDGSSLGVRTSAAVKLLALPKHRRWLHLLGSIPECATKIDIGRSVGVDVGVGAAVRASAVILS
jgi:hypothetical protein